MLAARWHGRGDVRVEEVDDVGPPPSGWLRIRVEACGICGTDVEEYTSGPVVIPTSPNPLSGRAAPLTLGHEAVGVVDAAGEGTSLAPGTRVAIESNIHCGHCFWCRRGEHQLCPDLASLGLMADGGLAEYLLAPATMCLPYGDHLSAAEAALAEPLSVALRALRRGGVRRGNSLAVIGSGPVGLLAVQAAKALGVGPVIAVERHDERRFLAASLGADAVCAPEESSEVAAKLTDGVGVDVTIEAAGNPGAAALAARLVRRGGRAVLLGVFDAPIAIDMRDFLFGEKEVVASLSHLVATDFAESVELLESGVINVAPLISDRIRLEDVVSAGFGPLAGNPEQHLKIIVNPNGRP